MKKPNINLTAGNNNIKTAQNVQEKFLKTGEVSKFLNIPKRTIQDWAKKGILIPHHTTNSYNYYTEQQLTNFCKSAQNLLKKFPNCAKSPTIKAKTAQNLENFFQNINQTAQNLLFVNCQNINKYNISLPSVIYSSKSKVSNRVFKNHKHKIKINELAGLKTLPSKKSDDFGVILKLTIHKPEPEMEKFFGDFSFLSQPLSEFDQAVHDVVVSLYIAGNSCITSKAIAKVLDHNSRSVLTKKKLIDIAYSMLKLYCHFITIITDDSSYGDKWASFHDNTCKFKGERKFYPSLKNIYQGRLIDFNIISSTNVDYFKKINGSNIPCNITVPNAWHILQPPVLYDYSATKKQVAATQLEYLDTSKNKANTKLPTLNRTKSTDNLTNFIAHEIDSMLKTANNKNPYSRFIKLKTIYEIDGINYVKQNTNNLDKKKFYSRQRLNKLLIHLKQNGLILGYTYHKKKQAIYSVEILI